MLVFTLTAGCALGWLTGESRRAKLQKETLAAIRDVGGRVVYAEQVDGGSAWWGKKLVRRVLGDEVFRRADRMSFQHASNTDVKTIGQPADLRDLRLNSRVVSDVGLAPLARLKNLERLDLWCEDVTDRSVRRLARLERL